MPFFLQSIIIKVLLVCMSVCLSSVTLFVVNIGFCKKLCINCYFSYAIISDKIYLSKMAGIISDNL